MDNNNLNNNNAISLFATSAFMVKESIAIAGNKDLDLMLERMGAKSYVDNLYGLKYRSLSLYNIPADEVTYEMCYTAIKFGSTQELKYVPQRFLTAFLCVEAFKKIHDVSHLIHFMYSMPETFFTPQICSMLVAKAPETLSHIPKQRRIYTLCLYAVGHQGYGYLLKDVPMKFRTLRMCLSAISSTGDQRQTVGYYILRYIPMRVRRRAPELVTSILRGDGLELYSCKLWERTYENCLIACEQNGDALRKVPFHFKTKKMCWTAIKSKKGVALEHVPFRRKTRRMCSVAVENNGRSLEFVYTEWITLKMCRDAIRSTKYDLRTFPDRYIEMIQGEIDNENENENENAFATTHFF